MTLELLMEGALITLCLFIALAAWVFVLSYLTSLWDRRKARQRQELVHWLRTGRPL